MTVENLPVRMGLDAELKARRHYRLRLCLKCLWGWKRVAHHAHLAEVRWVTRDGRRVALRKEVARRLPVPVGAARRRRTSILGTA